MIWLYCLIVVYLYWAIGDFLSATFPEPKTSRERLSRTKIMPALWPLFLPTRLGSMLLAIVDALVTIASAGGRK